MNDSDSTSPRLRQFAQNVFESVGGIVDPVEEDLLEVLLPGELAGRLGETLTIALHPEMVPEVPGSELLTYGSPLLDELVGMATEQGRVSRVYLTGLNLDDSVLDGQLNRGLRLEGAAMQIDRIKVKLFKYLLFTFKVQYTTDEREEELIRVGVNLSNGQIARRLWEVLDQTPYSEANYLICPEAESISVDRAYRIAREEVARKMIASLNFHQTAMANFIEQESRRINQFYQDNDRELVEQIRKAQVKSETAVDWTEADRQKSAAAIQVLQSKRQVNEIERKRRLGEMVDKHTLRTDLQLINLLQIAYPKLVTTVTLVETPPKSAGQPALSATIVIIWDALLQRPEPPTCATCGKPTTTLKLVRPPRKDPQVVCGTC